MYIIKFRCKVWLSSELFTKCVICKYLLNVELNVNVDDEATLTYVRGTNLSYWTVKGHSSAEFRFNSN